MKFVLSLICLFALCLVADAGDRKGKGRGAYAYACACANCPCEAQPAAPTKPTEVPVGNCATCGKDGCVNRTSEPANCYSGSPSSGNCASGNCGAPMRSSRRGR